MTLGDERYARFLRIYDDAYRGLTWSQADLYYLVQPESPWSQVRDGRIIQIRAGEPAIDAGFISEAVSFRLKRGGFNLEEIDECYERLARDN